MKRLGSAGPYNVSATSSYAPSTSGPPAGTGRAPLPAATVTGDPDTTEPTCDVLQTTRPSVWHALLAAASSGWHETLASARFAEDFAAPSPQPRTRPAARICPTAIARSPCGGVDREFINPSLYGPRSLDSMSPCASRLPSAARGLMTDTSERGVWPRSRRWRLLERPISPAALVAVDAAGVGRPDQRWARSGTSSAAPATRLSGPESCCRSRHGQATDVGTCGDGLTRRRCRFLQRVFATRERCATDVLCDGDLHAVHDERPGLPAFMHAGRRGRRRRRRHGRMCQRDRLRRNEPLLHEP